MFNTLVPIKYQEIRETLILCILEVFTNFKNIINLL